MAKSYYIYNLCGKCDGDGVVTTTSPIPPHDLVDITCPECLGPSAKFPIAGGIYSGWLEKIDE